jgi:hypothetical protein
MTTVQTSIDLLNKHIEILKTARKTAFLDVVDVEEDNTKVMEEFRKLPKDTHEYMIQDLLSVRELIKRI